MLKQGQADDVSLSLFAFARTVLLACDVSAISRYIGHFTIGLLLLLAIVVVAPGAAQSPAIPGLSAPLQSTSAKSARSEIASTDSHYLEFSSIPFTVRVLREVMPLAEAEVTVRTTMLEYETQPGDTVLGIAGRFGLNGTTLLYSNDALRNNPDSLRVGQRITILPVDGALHTVARGETLESIATKYKVDATAIASFVGNGLQPPYTLEAGQSLIIPGGVKPPAAQSVTPVSVAAPAAPAVPATATSGTASAPDDAQTGSGQFSWPMSGRISQGYWEGHRAIDIAAPLGTPIYASDAGYVATMQAGGTGYGWMVIVDHGNGMRTLYAHMSAFNVEVGQAVNKGDVLGYCGSTGWSTGPHVHFEVIIDGVRYNPLAYLP